MVAWTWSALERSPANLPEVTVIDCEQKWDADETAAGSLVAAEAEKKKNKKKKKKKKRNETTVEQEQEEEQLENGNGSGDAATHADDLSAPTATSAPAMGAKSTPPDNAASASAAAVATKDHSEAHPQRLEKLPTRGGVLRHDMPGRDAVEVGQALREALTYYRGIGLDHEQARLYEAAAAYRVKVRAICWPVDTSLPPVPPGAPPTDEPPEGMTLAPADWPLCSVVVNVGIVDADRGQDAGGNAGSGDDAAEATPSSKRPKTTVGTVRLEVECKLGATAVARRLFEWLLRVVEWRPKA